MERLQTIRALKDRGHSLRVIATMLNEGESRASGRRPPGGPDDERLTIVEVAERARVPVALVRSLEASGLVRPLPVEDERRYTAGDARAVRMVLSLVGGGVPMEEFMSVARTQIDAAAAVAEGAVQLFLRYVRQPLLDSGLTPEREADRLVGAFRLMVQAATELIAHNVQRHMLNRVEEEIERRGTGAERDAFRRQLALRGAGVP